MIRFIGVQRSRFQPPATFDEQKKDTGTEAEEHHRNAGGDAPKRARRRATIAPTPDDDVAGHGDEQFQNAAAQQPAHEAFDQ